jgi:hypothetical protein
MIKTKILMSFVFIGLTYLNGQTLDKKYVDNWILSTFPESSLENNVLYILNGIPYTNNSISYELSKYHQSDLIQISLIDKNRFDSLILCRQHTSFVLLTTKGMQTRKSIRQNLTKAKNKYSKPNIRTTGDIDIKKGEPVLIIDGKQIFYNDCYFEINKLKTSRVLGVNYIDRPVSLIYYGSNGINGLIEIKTK